LEGALEGEGKKWLGPLGRQGGKNQAGPLYYAHARAVIRHCVGVTHGGWSGLVSRFRRKPQPRHRRKNRVPGKTQQKLAGDSLLGGAGSGGSDWWGELRVQPA